MQRSIKGGVVAADKVLGLADKYLGAGHTEVSPGRWVSSDGLRQFRFGTHETSTNPLHAHFEVYDKSYFKGGTLTENTVVEIR